jgi:TatD DNase family protein
MIDSHAHLDMPEFDADRPAVIDRARAAGVRTLLCPIDIASIRSRDIVLDLAARDPGIRAAAGLHPHEAKSWSEVMAAAIGDLARAGALTALGEIGLDYHYNLSPPDLQRAVFRRQLDLAGTLGLPAIVHSREAGADILAAVDAAGFARGGILHCFTEDAAFAAAMIARGFWVSFSGILTFPKAEGLRETARTIPPRRLLVETDSPFLAPVPYRGRRAEPAYVVETARCLAGLACLSYADIEALLEGNFSDFLASAAQV